MSSLMDEYNRQFAEAIKKKYGVQETEANARMMEAETGRANQLATAPVNASIAYSNRMNADTNRNELLAKSPLYGAQAGHLSSLTEGQNITNSMDRDIYPYVFSQAKGKATSDIAKELTNRLSYGQQTNELISERNAITGENNPLIRTYDNSGNPVYALPSPKNISTTRDDLIDAAGMDSQGSVLAMSPERYKFNKTVPSLFKTGVRRRLFNWLAQPK